MTRNFNNKTVPSLVFLPLLLLASVAAAHPGWNQNNGSAEANVAAMDSVIAESAFTENSAKINTEPIDALPVLNNGRIKPLQSLARETILFVSGTFGKWGLSATQIYLGLATSKASSDIEIINVRSPELREQLGFTKKKRFFSLRELESSKLAEIAEALMPKEQQNSKSLSQAEKDTLEAYHQMWLTQQLVTGEHFARSVDIAGQTQNAAAGGVSPHNEQLTQLIVAWLGELAKNPQTGGQPLASELNAAVRAQQAPALFQHQFDNLDLEVSYTNVRPFLVAAVLFFLLGSAMLIPMLKKNLTVGRVIAAFAVPFFFQVAGFGTRVYITRFAPVTSMYGTMLWVSLGVGLFALLLFALYRSFTITGILWLGSAAILLLTENIPLVLNPDMDPIVAVLRSNYWLTIHVLTITISYAAFTVVMLIGNTALVRSCLNFDNQKFNEEYARYAYRMTQLGVFLLTVGIILGGIWMGSEGNLGPDCRHRLFGHSPCSLCWLA